MVDAGLRLPGRSEWPLASDARRRNVVLSLAIVGFGALAVFLGQANSWDLRNYHLYDGWAFWTGRGDRDFAAAQLQSYFNPLLATATYLLYTHTPPRVSAFVLGCVQGLNLIPLYLLGRRLLPLGVQQLHRWLPYLLALVGTLGATQLSELGASMGDNVVSLPLLAAMALTFGASRPSLPRSAAAGLLVGLAAGIKLTAVPFAAGLLLCIPLLADGWRARCVILLAGGGAALAAFLATDGFWLLHLYREFGDPTFPQFTHLLGGDYAPPSSLRDTRFEPRTWFEWLFYPLAWLLSPRRVSNAFFLDLRVPIACLALPLLLFRSAIDPSEQRTRILALSVAVAYAIWLPLFAIYRYLAPLEMLAPLLVALAFRQLHAKRTQALLGVLLVLMVIVTRPPGWGRLPAYSADFLEVRIPDVPGLQHATVVLAEDEPLAFLALAFPASTNFVRVSGNLLGPPSIAYGMDREATRRLAGATGPLYAMLANHRSERVTSALARQQLAIAGNCAPIRSNLLVGIHHAELCSLERTHVLQ